MWPHNSRNTLFQRNLLGACTFQYNYSYGNLGTFYLNCISNCAGGATSVNVILRYNTPPADMLTGRKARAVVDSEICGLAPCVRTWLSI